MAIEIGTLLISMQADVARLSSDMGKARRTVDDAMGGIVRAAGMARSALGLIGIGVSAAAFSSFIKGSIDAADQLNDLSQKTGTSVEMLAGMKLAADQSGTSMEAIAKSAQKLSTNMADKPELFKRFGVTAKDTTGAMIQLADMFAAMPDGVEKAALAQQLFGKSGAEMIPLLNQGSEALRAMVEEGKRLNPVTAEMAKQADQFNDDLAKLSAQFSGLGIAIAKDSLKPMTQIAASMADAAREGGLLDAVMVGLAQTWNALFTDDLLTRQQKITKELGKLREALDAPNVGAHGKNAISQRMVALQQELDGLTPKEQTKKPNEPNQDVARAACELSGGKWVNGKCERGGDGKTKKTDPFKLENEAWVREKEFQIAQLEEVRKAQEKAAHDHARAVEEANRIIFNTDPIARANAEWQHLLELQAAVGEEMLSDETIAKEYAQTFGESTDQMTVFAEQAGRNIQDAFAEFLFDPFKGGLDGMITGFEQTLRKMAAQEIASSVMDSVGAWGKTGGGAGSFLGDLVGSVFGKRAMGGPVSGGTPYVVGERGPELFVPQASGTIVPNDKMGRSVTVINNFTLSQPADRRTQEQVAAMAGAAIQSAMLRGA